jgi:thiol-disulfide isomerase/thioredoxin
MKKILVIIIIIVFALAFIILISGISKKLKEKDQWAENIKKLPEFSLSTTGNISFSTSGIKSGPLLIVYFHPECEHCQYEISELFNSKILESGITVMLVSPAERDSVINFLNIFPAAESKRLITLIDTGFVFTDIFRKAVIPSSYLYNRDLNLIAAFYGEYKIETILNRFNESE